MQKIVPSTAAWAVSAICLLISSNAMAQQLLVAEIAAGGYFELNAESRQEVVGGEIRLGDKSWLIQKVSVHNLIGASMVSPDKKAKAEYAVFSSSFSDQTAVGQPWVAARHYQGCDKTYNSFLAVYSVADEDKSRKLGAIPYSLLTESVNNSDDSTVYCFISKPPEKV